MDVLERQGIDQGAHEPHSLVRASVQFLDHYFPVAGTYVSVRVCVGGGG